MHHDVSVSREARSRGRQVHLRLTLRPHPSQRAPAAEVVSIGLALADGAAVAQAARVTTGHDVGPRDGGPHQWVGRAVDGQLEKRSAILSQ